MDFSEAYKYTGPTPKFSPDGKYVATTVDARCVIRDADSLAVMQIFSCQDRIQAIEWSPSSTHVMCCMYHRAIVQLWNVDEPSWACKIDEGPAGIASAQWSPTGQEVLVVAEHNIRMSVWSLTSQGCVQRPGPKFSDRGIRFSPNGSQVAVLERANLKDYLVVYADVGDAEQQPTRARVHTTDAADLAWSPAGDCIAVWDSCLTYGLHVYTPAGQLLGSFRAYDGALGIRAVRWSPSGQFLAVGSYDQAVRLVNHATWNEFAKFEHVEKLPEADDVVVFNEVRDDDGGADDEDDDDGEEDGDVDAPVSPSRMPPRRRYVVSDGPVECPSAKPDLSKADAALGVKTVAFSPSGAYLATVNESQPAAVWIWDVTGASLACLLLHERPVKHIAWEPTGDRLAICTWSKRLHFWTPDGASCVHMPLKRLAAQTVEWQNDGSAAVVCDRSRFCVAYMS